MRILDATTSVKSIWYQKNNPYTVFMDKRVGDFRACQHTKNDITYKIYPDIQAKWQFLPFKNESFDMIVFDPPFIFGKEETRGKSWIAKKYGLFPKEGWKEDFRISVCELFRVLKKEGVFIFKWSDINIDVSEALRQFPINPMFGTNSGKDNKTHWICFIKHNNENAQLSDF